MTLWVENLPGYVAVTQGEKDFVASLKEEVSFKGCYAASKGGYWDAEGSLRAFRKKTMDKKHRLHRSGLGRVLLRKDDKVVGAGTYARRLVLQVDAFQTTAAYSPDGKRFDPAVFLPEGTSTRLNVQGTTVMNMGLLEGLCVLPSAGLRGAGADKLIQGLLEECMREGSELVASMAVSKNGMRALARNGFEVTRTLDRGNGETTYYMVFTQTRPSLAGRG